MSHRRWFIAGGLVLTAAWFAPTNAQQSPTIDTSVFRELRWRSIGPLRAGRTRSAAGHPARPYTFYAGVVNGGVWKTTDAGRTWVPIFDDQPTQSIGAVVVAPSDPDIIYVGSGEGLQRPDLSVGDGVYKSTDAGATWTHLGLRDAQQIANIAVDPRNPDRLFVAALGHPYGPNEERGIYRSTDGSRTFEPVLQRDVNTGGNDVDIDPSNPQIVYANLWEAREGPWENAAWAGTGGIFKSTDGGTSWRQLAGGLPDNVNQANIAIAPNRPSRLYATVAAPRAVGIYRSDDGGESWTRITDDSRPAGRIGGGDLPVPIVDPSNADVVIMASTVSFKSIDGGRTWAPFKGAPGGEDYQGGWINPDNPDIVFMVADQGAVVTLNGGETWSSWYNQPTAQLYHVAADNDFPYRLCSGQQESGSACVRSRGNYGAISDRDWLPVGVDEYGYVAPDPLDSNLVYGGRRPTRFDRRTGLTSSVNPAGGGRGSTVGPPGDYRVVRTQPIVFSQADPHALYYGNNYLWKTTDGGVHWRRISPDLTRTTYALPASIGKYTDPAQVEQRGVIYTIGPSYIDPDRVWIGTDDGVIAFTPDGGLTWNDVTPPQIGPWWKLFMIEPGRFDVQTAYAAVNTLRIDDMRPHFYRTHDGGATWTEIVTGMGDAGPANAIREDPVRRGLLFASTEKGVYVSFDDGDHWQSLRLNLPASSVRDLIVKDNDIAVALHGRGFWILDDITPLRQIDATTLQQSAALFEPAPAWRVRWNTATDMPWPREEPVGENPPEGAAINYWLGRAANGPVTLEILTRDGRLVRRYSSTDPIDPIPGPDESPVPLYWYRPPHPLATGPGLHRFFWDVHYEPLSDGGGGRGGRLPIQAIPHNTAPSPGTPWVSPGSYTVRLTVDGNSYTQPIVVRQDPRVTTPDHEMQEVYDLTDRMYFGAVAARDAIEGVSALRAQVQRIARRASGAVAEALGRFAADLEDLQGPSMPAGPPAGGGRGGRGGGPGVTLPPGSLPGVASSLGSLVNELQNADVVPTANQRAAIIAALLNADDAMARWDELRSARLEELNAQLQAAGLPTLTGR